MLHGNRSFPVLPAVLALCLLLLLPAVSTAQSSDVGQSGISMADATNQAAGQIKKPPTVFDVTDPAVVFSKLGDGVAAWRATLGGSPNEFGVDTAGVVQGSIRPDFVPASLITFLLQYYKDNTEIGLAMGPGGVTAVTLQLQDQYNRDVSALAAQIYDAAHQGDNASNGSSQNTTGSGDGSSDTSSSGDDGNSTADSSSGSSSSNDDPADNSEDVPSLGQDDGSSSGGDDQGQGKKEVIVIAFTSPG